MLLLIDAGNTRIKWCYSEGDTLLRGGEFTHADHDWVARFHSSLCAGPPPSKVVVSNVSSASICAVLEAWIGNFAPKVPLEYVKAQKAFGGVVNGYDEPERLGADRWAALIGARTHTARAVCVVDCGTAVTIDALAPDGSHLGGAIAPGLHLMRDSLVRGTNGIRVDFKPLASAALGHDTSACVAIGALGAIAGLVERSVARLNQDYGIAECLVTGGDAALVSGGLMVPHRLMPELIFSGLLAIARGDGGRNL